MRCLGFRVTDPKEKLAPVQIGSKDVLALMTTPSTSFLVPPAPAKGRLTFRSMVGARVQKLGSWLPTSIGSRSILNRVVSVDPLRL